MRYVIRERFFRLGEDSDITDEQGRAVYHVDGKVLSLHQHAHPARYGGDGSRQSRATADRPPPDVPH